jgi:hypothetical protein
VLAHAIDDMVSRDPSPPERCTSIILGRLKTIQQEADNQHRNLHLRMVPLELARLEPCPKSRIGDERHVERRVYA